MLITRFTEVFKNSHYVCLADLLIEICDLTLEEVSRHIALVELRILTSEGKDLLISLSSGGPAPAD